MYPPRTTYLSIDSFVHLSAKQFSFLAPYLPIHPCTDLSTQPSTYPFSVFHIASARYQPSHRKGTVRKGKYPKGDESHGAIGKELASKFSNPKNKTATTCCCYCYCCCCCCRCCCRCSYRCRCRCRCRCCCCCCCCRRS